MKIRILVYFLIFLTPGFLFSQKPVAQYDHDIASSWFELQLKLIPKTAGFAPPVASRALGYTGVTLYQALIAGMPKYKTLDGTLQGLNETPKPKANQSYDWDIVTNSALAHITGLLYAYDSDVNTALINELKAHNLTKIRHQFSVNAIKESESFGEKIAEHIYKYSKSDGGHRAEKNLFPKDFKPTLKACAWQGVENQKALLPYWGNNRTMMAGSAEFDLPAPPRCDIGNTSILYVQALEVYSIGTNLSDEQKEIANFWADDAGKTFTPPGHAVSIALQMIKNKNLNLQESSELLARMGIAINDAFISCWKCKYTHYLLRPISFINSAVDPNWKPYLSTPPFPEYTSGHGTVSGAAAAVLSDIFGYNFAFVDHSHQDRGLKPRSFNSFEDFAEEAALSRLYGGIHYRMSNETGMKNGERIGRKACELKIKMHQGE